MNGLRGIKQSMKELYGKIDFVLLPILKFALAFFTFSMINSAMGYMESLSNIFIVLIMAVLCSILPLNMIVLLGFVLVLGHSYALGIETAAFALILVIVLLILFLRFSGKSNLAFILSPIAFQLQIPAILPIGCGLLSGPSAAVPAGCGVILYQFMKMVKAQEELLSNPDGELVEKLQVLLDGLVKNSEMWISIMAVVAVSLVVYVIRKLFLNYSWHIAIVVGAVAYVVIMVAGGMVLSIELNMVTVAVSTIVSMVLAFILEFFVMGVDFSRTKNLQFEDDEFVYYVKAVPKSFVREAEEPVAPKKKEAKPRKKIKEAVPVLEEAKDNSSAVQVEQEIEDYLDEPDEIPVDGVDVDEIDFEKQLENSLKDL